MIWGYPPSQPGALQAAVDGVDHVRRLAPGVPQHAPQRLREVPGRHEVLLVAVACGGRGNHGETM